MNVPDAVDFYKPDAAYQNVTWHLDLVSELDFTKEACEFDSHEDAQSAWQDNIDLIELKIKQLQKMLDEVSTQPIRTVVDRWKDLKSYALKTTKYNLIWLLR